MKILPPSLSESLMLIYAAPMQKLTSSVDIASSTVYRYLTEILEMKRWHLQ
jgi:hypothetical protein